MSGRRHPRRPLFLCLVALTVGASMHLTQGNAAGADASSRSKPGWIISESRVASARRYALSRQGLVAFSVLDSGGRLRGLRGAVTFPSASVVKAMLLVSVLRHTGARHLSEVQHARLQPMIEESNNADAVAVWEDEVGRSGLEAVGRAARMTHLSADEPLFNTQLTTNDQARFFYVIDKLVPPTHRRYARHLLASIVPWQRWGIAPVAERLGLRIFFKGGWREGIVHQSALLERDHQRVSLSILTSGDPSMAYGEETLSGIAERLLA